MEHGDRSLKTAKIEIHTALKSNICFTFVSETANMEQIIFRNHMQNLAKINNELQKIWFDNAKRTVKWVCVCACVCVTGRFLSKYVIRSCGGSYFPILNSRSSSSLQYSRTTVQVCDKMDQQLTHQTLK